MSNNNRREERKAATGGIFLVVATLGCAWLNSYLTRQDITAKEKVLQEAATVSLPDVTEFRRKTGNRNDVIILTELFNRDKNPSRLDIVEPLPGTSSGRDIFVLVTGRAEKAFDIVKSRKFILDMADKNRNYQSKNIRDADISEAVVYVRYPDAARAQLMNGGHPTYHNILTALRPALTTEKEDFKKKMAQRQGDAVRTTLQLGPRSSKTATPAPGN